MNKPRSLMIRLNDTIRSTLSRGLPTWREKVSVGIIAFAILLGIALIRDRHQAESAYWEKPLTCRGSDFREVQPDPDSAPDEPRSIFRMSDQMVLAIPRHYLGGPWDENLPATIAHCGSISDLPQIQHLYIRIKGRWSGTYDVRELPRDNNGDLEYPDIAGLHVLPPDVRPAWAAQKPIWNRAFINTPPFGPAVPMKNGFLCHGNRCWFPVLGEADLYGSIQFLDPIDMEPNITAIYLHGVTLRGLEISGKVTLRDVYQTLPAVISSVQDHLDRWNIVRPKETENRPQVGKEK
jgi:hypothetical protein